MNKYKAIPDGYMTVGEVAKKMDITVRTLQHYDKEGLLSPSAMSEGGRRLYTDKDIVKLEIESPNGRSLTFGDVVVRVSASYATAAHIDTDEANALAPGKECYGEMTK